MKRLAACLSALALLCGCTGLSNLETPRLSFVSMKMLEASLFEQRLEVRLRVQNPNDLALPVRGLNVDVELAGQDFAHGVSAREFTVPPFGEAEFDMIVTANAATTLMKLATGDRKSREAVDYRIKGELSTRLGLLRTIPFEETGKLPLASVLSKGLD